MPNKIERLEFIRKRLTADINRQSDTINGYDNDTEVAVLVSRREALEELWSEYRANNDAIEASKENTCTEAFIEETAEVHEMYLTAQAKLIQLTPENTTLHQSLSLFRHEKNRSVQYNDDHSESHSVQDDESNEVITSTPGRGTIGLPATIKLPAIQIKCFTGIKIDWPEFKATCENTFTGMDEVNQFRYLKSHLDGEPSRMIKHLPLCKGSYAKAWEILTNRYDNPRAIINANLQRMFELPFSKNESSEALKTMLDITNECIAAINGYDINTATWHPILIFMLTQRLDATSIKHWEEKIQGKKTVPEFKEFLEFLNTRINVLETTSSNHDSPNLSSHVQSQQIIARNKQKILLTMENNIKCMICSDFHRTYKCPIFMNKNIDERQRLIVQRKLCSNCLYPHSIEACTSKFLCRICGLKHHSLLHPPENISTVGIQQAVGTDTFTGHISRNESFSQVILATAIIRVTHEDKTMLFRALIDQGSMTNLISKRACETLDLPQYKVDIPITGVGGTNTFHIQRKAHFKMSSYFDSESIETTALVIPKITTLNLISHTNNYSHLRGLQLADPKIDKSGRIDILIGAATFSEILLNGVIRGDTHQPIAQQTKFGWITSGKSGNNHNCNNPIVSIITSDESLANALQKFWESEEIPAVKPLSPEEKLAEEFYAKTTKRCDDGRYMVKLPFKSDQNKNLGESYDIAQRRYINMKKRLDSNIEFCKKYNDCIQEYLDLNQMEITTDTQQPHYYLPHHPVVKDSSSTTKIRPVFDASCKTKNGKSLNNELLIGPTIQPDLFSLLIHWRKYEYAISSDIEKMYRQIWIDPDDTHFQRILWQSADSTEIKSYHLKTVTFGVASAPFLAIRTLFQIGIDIQHSFPHLTEKIQNQFYVDDYLDSFASKNEAKETVNQITEIMNQYGMKLRKWKSNNNTLLDTIPPKDKEESTDHSSTFKTLGIQWQPATDQFIFLPSPLNNSKCWTKRTILSDISKLFDPLGWLAPCVILAKMFMQNLWRLPITWDDELPKSVVNEWLKIRSQFTTTCSVKIPRWMGLSKDIKHISLQGFSDASEKSCACVVYVRIEHLNETIICNLIAAKTKVAPIKQISLPRLELNAAVLLAKLMDKVKEAIKIPDLQQNAWTDSTIVLSWLADHPNRWKTYIANRVAEIQRIVPSKDWRHVNSKLNAADCASRGITCHELENFNLWWQGPSFLCEKKDKWPEFDHNNICKTLEERKQKALINNIKVVELNPVIHRFSNYSRMLRVIALCLYWLQKIQLRKATPDNLQKIEKITDLNNIEIRLVKLVQEETFSEIEQFRNHNKINMKSCLKNLDPFLDENEIMRVGGRIHKAALTENEKHQVILPTKHHFTNILIQQIHLDTLHGGLGDTLQKIRQKFWIVNGKTRVNSILRKCVTCFRFKKKLLTQKMGNLPYYRLQEAIPFTFTGIDYAGYFDIKTSSRKNAPFAKGYIALFICQTTRAIHLELVSDLSSTQFLKAFKRFISRRGMPKKIYSDNGTNFIGASKEIHNMWNQTINQTDSEFRKLLTQQRIEWSNIPPRAPHFGGGWESSVKIVKNHLKRVLGNIRLNFEDFNTLIIEIEAVVNSRPLWSIPANIDEYEPLTPGHFLIFKALNTLPEPNVSNIPFNRLNQYQYLRRLLTEFWKLWSKEYIQQLQIRKKWVDTEPNLRKNQIVLVAEDNEQPSYWSLGIVITVIPGNDGLVRVADILCNSKIIRRPIHKLSLLPILDNTDKIEQ